MLIRKSQARSRLRRFGAGNDYLNLLPEDAETALFTLPDKSRSLPFAPPLKSRKLARVAMLASPRVREGFAWHNACYDLSPANWRIVIEKLKPDYLLVESCFRDSASAWPYACLNGEAYSDLLAKLAEKARERGIPSIYWHTQEDIAAPGNTLARFDIVACASEEIGEQLAKAGLKPRLLPWAFAPERFNPLVHARFDGSGPRLLFNGVARVAREPRLAAEIEKFADADLAIYDTALVIPPYNLARMANRKLADRVIGDISQTDIQDVYKDAGALLVASGKCEEASSRVCRGLEAAASGIPVLHIGANEGIEADYAQSFASGEDALAQWQYYRANPLEMRRAGHKAWRGAHKDNTFAARMATIHEWLGLPADPRQAQKASLIVPSNRPQNFESVIAGYLSQTWPNKELLYVFNGPEMEMPRYVGREDIKMLRASGEQAIGMALNTGVMRASGDVVFKIDDDDLYGPEYISDRMIFFREFAIDSLSSGNLWVTFGESGKARCGVENETDNTVFSYGEAKYHIPSFHGGSLAMTVAYAKRIGFTNPAHNHVDVALVMNGMQFSPASAHLRTDSFNFCQYRGDVGSHTWRISEQEIGACLNKAEVPIGKAFA